MKGSLKESQRVLGGRAATACQAIQLGWNSGVISQPAAASCHCSRRASAQAWLLHGARGLYLGLLEHDHAE